VSTGVQSSPFVLSVDWGTTVTICVEYQLEDNRYHLCQVSTGVQPLPLCRLSTGGTTVTIFVQYRLGYNRYHVFRVSTGVQRYSDSYFHFTKSIFRFVLKKSLSRESLSDIRAVAYM
jgi:hypothetical protein